MPINKSALLRYMCIHHVIKQGKGASLESFKKQIDKEFENTNDNEKISKETIKKDLQYMRSMLGAPIGYNKQDNTYYYTKEEYTLFSLSDDYLQNLFNHLKLSQIVGKPKELSQIIQFETETNKVDFNLILQLALAIKNNKAIEFSYAHLSANKTTEVKLIPCFIKENRNYFYLIGKHVESGKTDIFNLQRVKNIILTRKRYQLTKEELKQLNSVFENNIGISTAFKKTENVILQFEEQQLKYVIEKPLHKSQKIIQGKNSEKLVSLTVEPNYELMANILSYGAQVKVISPLSLKQEHINILKKSLLKYKGT